MRYIFKIMIPLTLLFAALVGLIRAQPYDDSKLRAFIIPPDNCPMPCFMGIRPGVTTVDEALAILESHEWVKRIHVTSPGGTIDIVQWSGHQPDFIDISNTVRFMLSSTGEVIEISIPTLVSAGYIHLLLGSPSDSDFYPYPFATDIPLVNVANVYRDLSLIITVPVFCPLSVESFWRFPARITLSSIVSELTGLNTWSRRFRLYNSWCY